MVQNHVNELYDSLLEQNLLRLVEPFSRVEVRHSRVDDPASFDFVFLPRFCSSLLCTLSHMRAPLSCHRPLVRLTIWPS